MPSGPAVSSSPNPEQRVHSVQGILVRAVLSALVMLGRGLAKHHAAHSLLKAVLLVLQARC